MILARNKSKMEVRERKKTQATRKAGTAKASDDSKDERNKKSKLLTKWFLVFVIISIKFAVVARVLPFLKLNKLTDPEYLK